MAAFRRVITRYARYWLTSLGSCHARILDKTPKAASSHGNLLFLLMKKIAPVLLGCALAGLAVAAPHVPKEDGEVLERLPARRGDPAMAELRNLRAAAAARPGD